MIIKFILNNWLSRLWLSRLWLSRLWLSRKALSVIVIRRYKITSGSVGELYVDGYCVGDTLDTFSDNALRVYTHAIVDEFYIPRKDNCFVTNASMLDDKRLNVEFRNNWVGEC